MPQDDYTRIDAKLFFRQMVFAVLALCVSVIVLLVCWNHFSGVLVVKDDVRKLLTVANTQQRNADRLVSMIDGYDAQYNKLLEEQYFDDDLKLRWLESFGKIANELDTLSVDYDIGVLARDENFDAVGDGLLEVYKMPVSVRINMLHEGDLMNFKRKLSEANLGLFVSNGCELVRDYGELNLRVLQVNLHSYCTYDAYRIKLL